MSSGLCDVIWSTADKGAAVEPKDFSCVNRHLRNIKYAEGIPELQYVTDMEDIYIYIYDMGVLGSKTQNFKSFMTKKSDENQLKTR